MNSSRLLPASYSPDPNSTNILPVVQGAFDTRAEGEPCRHLVLYDTFDWRIYRRQESLWSSRDSGEKTLSWEARDGSLLNRVTLGNSPDFAWCFPEGPFREAITPIIEMRRLFPMLEIRCERQFLRILDRREKTVARLSVETGQIRKVGTKRWKTAVPLTVRAVPVRGYSKAFRRLKDLLDQELSLAEDDRSLFQKAIGLAYPDAGRYSSKLNVSLEPDLRSDEAAKRILVQLLNILLTNEKGTRLDWDTEFLHDFRVSGRRTRSALTQIKGVFPTRVVDRFRQGFKWLGNVTGPTRDLDVYLLKMPDYQKSLPPTSRNDLAPLVEFLRRRQYEEQQRVSKTLQSVRYRRLVQAWDDFLNEPVPVRTSMKNAHRPISELASERIWRAFRRVIKKGRAITSTSPAELLHRVRIDCKKLRYLLEFFRTLYDPVEMKELIRSLKGLQDCLGDFNDYEVQQHSLKAFAEQMLSEGTAAAPTLLSMGCLIDQFEQSQAKEKLRFEEMFQLFADPDNEKRCRSLFSQTRRTRRISD